MSNPFRLFRHHQTFLLAMIVTSCSFLILMPTCFAETSTSEFAMQNYMRLQAELPYYEKAVNDPQNYPWPMISGSQILHPGSHSSKVLLLRQRLQTTNDLARNSEYTSVFDETLTQAVKVFQWRHGLNADGVVGSATREALNIPAETRLQQIKLNMQRWADLADTVNGRYILVNIPEYQLHVIDNNDERLNMKIVVGKPTRQTPELTSTITRIVFNPAWNVPHKIAKNDIVKKILEDPDYLDDNRIRIFSGQENDSYEINRRDIDWRDVMENGFSYHFRQDPGIKNALGLVKFEFQNTFDVYLHDTPAKELFAQDKRDFSSGCIRLEKPFALVAYLTQQDEKMDSNKLREFLESRHTRYFRLANAMPILITYITSWVDKEGLLHFVEDVYQRDAAQPSQDGAS
jgi:murein L,D-transpeptidase YcbB/YkuD